MNIDDKRELIEDQFIFGKLDIGEVYEDNDGNICIKTAFDDKFDEYNCITFEDGEWSAHHEQFDAKVIRIEADLILRRNK